MNTLHRPQISNFTGLGALFIVATVIAQGCGGDENPAPGTPTITGGTGGSTGGSGAKGGKAGKGGSGGDSAAAGIDSNGGDDATGGTTGNTGGTGTGGSGNRGGSGNNVGGTGNNVSGTGNNVLDKCHGAPRSLVNGSCFALHRFHRQGVSSERHAPFLNASIRVMRALAPLVFDGESYCHIWS